MLDGTAGDRAGAIGGGGSSASAGQPGTAGTPGAGGTLGSAGAGASPGHAGAGGATAGTGGATAGAGGATAGTSGDASADADGAGPCSPGEIASCACAPQQVGTQVCLRDKVFAACMCLWSDLAPVRDGIVGTWVGMDQPGEGGGFPVKLVFGADGHFTGHCNQAGGCPAPVLNYGSDDDSPEKTYRLNSLLPDGTAVGDIAFYFFPGDTNQGAIQSLLLSPDGQQLRFDAWAFWNAPPNLAASFDLTRVK
jgi:hypothetical protein